MVVLHHSLISFCRQACGLLLILVATVVTAQEMATIDTNLSGLNGTEIDSAIAVQFEYRLEVNHDTVFAMTSKEDARSSTITIEQVLRSEIAGPLLESLQSMLPHGGVTAHNNGMMPNVRFVSSSSNIFSACFTDSDACALVRTTLQVEHDGPKPPFAIERATYKLVKEYFDNVTKNGQSRIIVTYLYPFWVSSAAQFRLSPMGSSLLTTDAVEIMEASFLEVVGATVAAIEGDSEIKDIRLIYQDLMFDDENPNATIHNNTLSADFVVQGICRECSDKEFAGVVNDIIPSNLGAFRNRLQQNGAFTNITYFSTVERIDFDVPKPPLDLPSIQYESLYDTKVPSKGSNLPIFFFLGIFFAVGIILTGFFFIWKDVQDYEYEKDDDHDDDNAFSTASESVMGENDHMDEEDISAGQDNTAYRLNRMAVEEYDIREDNNFGIADRTSLKEYQVETVLSNEVMDDRLRSYTYAEAPPPPQRRQWPREPDSGTSYFGGNGRAPASSRPPRGARRTSATVSPATGMPYNSYA